MHFIINNTPLNKRRRRRNFWFPAIRAICNDFWLWLRFTATAKFYRYRFPSLPSVPSVVFDSIDDNEKYLIGHAHSCSLLQQAQLHFTQIALIKDSTSVAISLLLVNDPIACISSAILRKSSTLITALRANTFTLCPLKALH